MSDIQSGLILVREQPAQPVLTARLGYAWADRPASASYQPPADYTFNSAGGPITVKRQGTGRYTIRFAGLGGNGRAGGHVEVTSYGPGSERCTIGSWSSDAADFVANVLCFDTTGSAIDARYTVLVRW